MFAQLRKRDALRLRIIRLQEECESHTNLLKTGMFSQTTGQYVRLTTTNRVITTRAWLISCSNCTVSLQAAVD
jgi:hypothetical protein